MNLRDEIAALRAEIDARARTTRAEAVSSSSPPASDERRTSGPHDVETLFDMVNATLDEFADELDRFPKLTAVAALGIGLALGVVIGRRLR